MEQIDAVPHVQVHVVEVFNKSPQELVSERIWEEMVAARRKALLR